MKVTDNRLKMVLIVISLYVSTQIFSDILGLKIINIPFINFSVTAGILLYPLTFTIRDIAHKVLGKKNVTYLIFLTIFLNICMIGLLYLVIYMEPGSEWVLQDSFEEVFLPVWRITLASIFAEMFSQLADTYVFSRIYRQTKSDFSAVLWSNVIGSISDSILFVMVAFLGSMNMEILGEIILVQIVIKILVSLILAPSIKYLPMYSTMEQI